MTDVLIVGAGMTGLSCARHLLAHEVSVQLIEAGDAVGGRMRTDIEDGFTLDRGFQILLTAYPEVQQQIDIAALQVGSFTPGAGIWHSGRFHNLTDPWRVPSKAFSTLFDSTLPFADKMRISRLRASVGRGGMMDVFARPEVDTLTHLRELGFSATAIKRFFRPFFGGVFLESSLTSSSRWFEFLFRIFSEGESVLPKDGMQAIPQQFAGTLPEGVLRLNTKVERYELLKADGRNTGVRVYLEGGETIEARSLVLAAQASASRSIVTASTGRPLVEDSSPVARWNRTTTFYYAAEKSPSTEKLLWLNGEGRRAGPVNNACIVLQYRAVVCSGRSPSHLRFCRGGSPARRDAAPSAGGRCAGAPRSLVRRRSRCALETPGAYFIEEALPLQTYAEAAPRPRSIGPGVFLAGDYCAMASLNGALASGRTTAEAVFPQLLR